MKKLLFVFVCIMMILFSQAAFATEQTICVVPDAENTIKVSFSVSEGEAIVGHFGIKYNKDKFELLHHDKTALPEVIPEKTESGSSYITEIIKSSASGIVITSDANKVSELILPERGIVLFGWYSEKDVVANKEKGNIAEFFFKLKDSALIEGISGDDFSLVSNDDCKGIAGWSSGIIAIGSDEKAYLSETDTENKLKTQMVFGEEVKDEDVKDETDEDSADKTGKENDDVADELNFEAKDFNIDFVKNGDNIRIKWKNIYGAVSRYCLTVTDANKKIITRVDGIVSITKSYTIKNLTANDSININLSAYGKDGNLIASTNLSNVR